MIGNTTDKDLLITRLTEEVQLKDQFLTYGIFEKTYIFSNQYMRRTDNVQFAPSKSSQSTLQLWINATLRLTHALRIKV